MSLHQAHARLPDRPMKGRGLKNVDEYAEKIARRKDVFSKHQQFRNGGPKVTEGYDLQYNLQLG